MADCPAESTTVAPPTLPHAQQQAQRRLTQAYAHDHIDTDELERRLELVERAIDQRGVSDALADLPASDPPPTKDSVQPAATSLARLEAPAEGRTVAILSSSRRTGVWTPARLNRIFAVFGKSEIDLREACLPQGELVIDVVAILSTIELTVRPGTRVQLDVAAVVGSAEQQTALTPPEPGDLVVRVTGVICMGSVKVCERLPGEGRWVARKRRKAQRKAQRTSRALPPGS